MADGQGLAYRRVVGVLKGGAAAGWSDGDLVERVRTRDGEVAELAFAALVERHGPMVLRTCRAALGGLATSQADDAFQAVFLVLARRSGSIRPGDSLGPWLRQVALRVCRNARRVAQRRDRHEAASARGRGELIRPACSDGWPELHEELERLPARFREPLALCYLDGLTHDQAAARLGWPLGTVRSRLARGRERLKTALIRRGVSPAVALSLHLPRLSSPVASALVPHSLRELTIRTAVRVARDSSPIPAGLALLVAEGTRQISFSGFQFMCTLVTTGLFATILAFVPPQAPGEGKPAAVAPVVPPKILTIPLPTPEHTVSIEVDGPEGSKTYAVVPDGQGSLAVVLTQAEKDARKTYRFRADGIALQPGAIKAGNDRVNKDLIDAGLVVTAPVAEKTAQAKSKPPRTVAEIETWLETYVRRHNETARGDQIIRTPEHPDQVAEKLRYFDEMLHPLETKLADLRKTEREMEGAFRSATGAEKEKQGAEVAVRTATIAELRLAISYAEHLKSYYKSFGNTPPDVLPRALQDEQAKLREDRIRLEEYALLINSLPQPPKTTVEPSIAEMEQILAKDPVLTKLMQDSAKPGSGLVRAEGIKNVNDQYTWSVLAERLLRTQIGDEWMFMSSFLRSIRKSVGPANPKDLEQYKAHKTTIGDLLILHRYAARLRDHYKSKLPSQPAARPEPAPEPRPRSTEGPAQASQAIPPQIKVTEGQSVNSFSIAPDGSLSNTTSAKELPVAEMEALFANAHLPNSPENQLAKMSGVESLIEEGRTPDEKARKYFIIHTLLLNKVRSLLINRPYSGSIQDLTSEQRDVLREHQKTLNDLQNRLTYAARLRDHYKALIAPKPTARTEAVPEPKPRPAAKPTTDQARPSDDAKVPGDPMTPKAQADLHNRLLLLDADIDLLRAEIRRLDLQATIAPPGKSKEILDQLARARADLVDREAVRKDTPLSFEKLILNGLAKEAEAKAKVRTSPETPSPLQAGRLKRQDPTLVRLGQQQKALQDERQWMNALHRRRLRLDEGGPGPQDAQSIRESVIPLAHVEAQLEEVNKQLQSVGRLVGPGTATQKDSPADRLHVDIMGPRECKVGEEIEYKVWISGEWDPKRPIDLLIYSSERFEVVNIDGQVVFLFGSEKPLNWKVARPDGEGPAVVKLRFRHQAETLARLSVNVSNGSNNAVDTIVTRVSPPKGDARDTQGKGASKSVPRQPAGGLLDEKQTHLDVVDARLRVARQNRANIGLERDRLNASHEQLMRVDAGGPQPDDAETIRKTAQQLAKFEQDLRALQMEIHALERERTKLLGPGASTGDAESASRLKLTILGPRTRNVGDEADYEFLIDGPWENGAPLILYVHPPKGSDGFLTTDGEAAFKKESGLLTWKIDRPEPNRPARVGLRLRHHAEGPAPLYATLSGSKGSSTDRIVTEVGPTAPR